ncbi:MAG: TRAP transporter substrate-binding protein [Cohaesibacteraceae bacterium]
MKFTNFGLATAFATALTVTSPAAQAEELSFATFLPHNHETITGMYAWFESEVEERSGGTLSLRLYPAGQLGAGPTQQYRRALEGVADITFGLAASTPTLFPRSLIATLPGRAVDAEDATRRIWTVYDEYLVDEWTDVKLLALGTAAGRMLVGNRDLSTLDGMQGAKLVPFAAMTTPVVQGMGMVPVQMEPSEHYTALSTGTIDAAVSTINNLLPPWNLDEVADYAIINTPASQLVLFMVMNRERYESLSAEHQQGLDDISGLPLSLALARSFADYDDYALQWIDEQIKVGELNVEWIITSDDERAKMETAVADGMEEIYQDYAERGIDDAREIYEALNQ